jgi:3-hydroxyisobutyrate dehydrogenase
MSADAIKRICFVGIGNMGWPMAARLVRAGFEVAVTDVVAGRATAFVDQVGGKAVVSLAEATKEADVVVTMLPTSVHVVSVVDEILPSLSSGKILLDMSSGAPAATQKIAGAEISGPSGCRWSMRPSVAACRVPSPVSLRS